MKSRKIIPIRPTGGKAAPSPWAKSYGTLVDGSTHIAALDAVAYAMERVWGIDRLWTLVPADLAARFNAQRYKVNHAIWESADLPELQRECARMQAAWRSLDKAAREAGALPIGDVTPHVWEAQLKTGDLLAICRSAEDAQAWAAKARGNRRAQVWLLDEIVNMIDGQHFVQSIKHAFDGAHVEAARRPADPLAGLDAVEPIDRNFAGDDLPF